MLIFTSNLSRLLLILGLVLAQSCSQRPEDLPTPAISPIGVSVNEAQTWYQTTYPNSFAPNSAEGNFSATARSSGPSRPRLAWSQALAVGQGNQQLVLVPLVSN